MYYFYRKVSNRLVQNRERLEASNSDAIEHLFTKDQRLERMCQKAELQPPCSPTQVH